MNDSLKGCSIILLKSLVIMVLSPFILAFIYLLFTEKSALACMLSLIEIVICGFLIYVTLFFEKLMVKYKRLRTTNAQYKNNTATSDFNTSATSYVTDKTNSYFLSDEPIIDEILSCLEQGEESKAIKIYKNATRRSFAISKLFIDNLQSQKSGNRPDDKCPIKLNKEFNARAFHTVHNRWKTVKNIIALNEDKVREILNNSDFREPYQIEEIFRKPSERQIEYASLLGIRIPPGASIDDISALICMNKDEDVPSDVGLIEYATEKDLYISRYTGRNALYNRIFSNIPPKDKIVFFIFCVYRWLSADRESNPNKSKYRDLFYEFSDKMLSDDSFIKSLRRYEGENLIWFGTFTYKWNDYSGGSKNTKAYKACARFLEDRLGILEGSNAVNLNMRKIKQELLSDYRYDGFPPIRDTNRSKSYNQNQGCLNTIVITLCLFLVFLILI